METPKTLLDIAGARPAPAALSAAALVLIDAQRQYLEGPLALTAVEAAVAEAARLLDRARTAGAPVLHVLHHGRPGAPAFDPESELARPIEALAPRPGEAVVIKALPNAFAGTDLDARLRATGRSALIVASFATHMCVSSTVRAALDLGWRSTVVAGATATRALPAPLGGIVPAEAVQAAALAALGDRFASVVADAAALEG